MALNGIDAVVFGVADMGEASRFLDDWGVVPVTAPPDRLIYRTRDGAEVIVRRHDAKASTTRQRYLAEAKSAL